MKSTYEDNFEKLTDDWASADKECTRLYMLWNEACTRRRRLARLKNRAWVELNAARVTELSNGPLSKGADFRTWWERGLHCDKHDQDELDGMTIDEIATSVSNGERA